MLLYPYQVIVEGPMKQNELANQVLINEIKTLLTALSQYLGESCEIVLHSLQDYTNSVIFIANGHHTGRKVGAPITDYALDILKQIESEEDDNPNSRSKQYFTRNTNQQCLKSSTTVIKGIEGEPIALVCFNWNLNDPFHKVMASFIPESFGETDATETFAETVDDLMVNVTQKVIQEVDADETISFNQRNKTIIQRLYERGIFELKDAPIRVAESLKISRNTVYLHLRNLEEK